MSEFAISTNSDVNLGPYECECILAVKIKDGGQICQVCHGDAYDNRYVFSHTEEGKRLMELAQGDDEEAFEEYASEVSPSRVGVDDPAPVPAIPAIPALPVAPQVVSDPMAAFLASEAPAIPALPSVPAMPTTPTAVWVDPADKPSKPAKVPKAPKAPKAVKTVNPLLEAVEFVCLAQKAKGNVMETHGCMKYGAITAFDRTIAAGALIPHSELDCFPNTGLLQLAMSRCGEQYKIVQTGHDLLVESGMFSAHVTLADPATVTTAIPDKNVAALSNKFRDALKIVGKLVKDTAPKLSLMAVQLNPYTCLSTNGEVIIDAYHGHDFPAGVMLVPKRFCDAIGKTKRNIIGFGYTPGKTFTVWFEGNWWLRTNLYEETLPMNYQAQLNVPTVAKREIPAGFFAAADEVANWSGNGLVYCFNNSISSHPPNMQNVGGTVTYPMDGFADCRVYSKTALKLVAKMAEKMDTMAHPALTMFWGGIVRGALAHQKIDLSPVERVAPTSTYVPNEPCGMCEGCLAGEVCWNDDDIPF